MGVLLMLTTICGLTAAVGLMIISFVTGKTWLRAFVFGGVAVWFVCYVALLLGVSLTSEEKELGLNEPKEFCGFYLDCHLHTAVTDIQRTKNIGDKRANGEFYIVRVKVFSDAKRATLGFDGLKLFVVDDDGRFYPRRHDAENPAPPFTQPVPAGGSFEKDIVFDLPIDVKNPRMDVHDNKGWIEKFLIGDEDSFLHKRRYFKLEAQNSVARN